MLDKNEVKHFLSNMVIDDKQVTLQWLLWVAFSRWPIERCFEIGKRDLGMDHFEMRNWQGIHRHFYITQLTMLFCAQVQQSLREKNSKELLSYGRTSSSSRRMLDYRPMYGFAIATSLLSTNCRNNSLLSKAKSIGQKISPKENIEATEKIRNKCQQIKELCAV